MAWIRSLSLSVTCNVFIYPIEHGPCKGNKHLYIMQYNASQIGLYKIRISLTYTGRLNITPNGERLLYRGGYYRIFASALIFSNYISCLLYTSPSPRDG